MTGKRLPLPHRFAVATTEAAYDRLRALNQAYGLSNNYLLTILLERLDDFVDTDKLDTTIKAFISEYGAPAQGGQAMPRTRARSGPQSH